MSFLRLRARLAIILARLRYFMSGSPPNPSILTLFPDTTQRDTVRTWCGNAVVAENVGYARTARVLSVVHSRSRNGKNHEDIVFEVQMGDNTSWILTDRSGGSRDSTSSLLPSPITSRSDLAVSISSSDAFDRIVVPEFGKLEALKLYIDDDPVVACTLKLPSSARFSLDQLAGLLPIVSAKAKKYNPVSKQCYWYARAVYESIKKKYPDSEEIRGKAYDLRGTHLKFPVPCKASKDELDSIEAQWSARILDIMKVETISQMQANISAAEDRAHVLKKEAEQAKRNEEKARRNEEEARRNEEEARRHEEEARRSAAEEKRRRLALEAELREVKEILSARGNT